MSDYLYLTPCATCGELFENDPDDPIELCFFCNCYGPPVATSISISGEISHEWRIIKPRPPGAVKVQGKDGHWYFEGICHKAAQYSVTGKLEGYRL